MFAGIMNSLCFCNKPVEKNETIIIINEDTILENQNEFNKKSTSIYKENEFKNLNNRISISSNNSKQYSTISSTAQYGTNSGNNLDIIPDKNKKTIRKYKRNHTKKTSKTVEEIYDEFLLKVDFIIEEFKDKQSVSESDDYESKKE